MNWFNGNITITTKHGTNIHIHDVPFDDRINQRVDAVLAKYGYTVGDVLFAQYFPSTLDLCLDLEK